MARTRPWLMLAVALASGGIAALLALRYLRQQAQPLAQPFGSRMVVAARPLPDAHRYGGRPFGVLIGSIPLHVVEHAAQIRQFLNAAGASSPRGAS